MFGYDVPTTKATYIYIGGKNDSQLAKMLPIVNKEFKFDNTGMKNVLGVNPRRYPRDIV